MMVECVKSYDFKNPDGSLKWAEYKVAQVSNGENCYQCGGFILSPTGKRSLCYQCKYMASDAGERLHDSLLRCPHCKHLFEAIGDDQYSRYQEGEHTATCYECEKEFTFTTHVFWAPLTFSARGIRNRWPIAYSFTSPPIQSANAANPQTVETLEGSANIK